MLGRPGPASRVRRSIRCAGRQPVGSSPRLYAKHQRRAGVAARRHARGDGVVLLAVHDDPILPGRDNRGHGSDRQTLGFKPVALLDMRLEKGAVPTGLKGDARGPRQTHCGQAVAQPAASIAASSCSPAKHLEPRNEPLKWPSSSAKAITSTPRSASAGSSAKARVAQARSPRPARRRASRHGSGFRYASRRASTVPRPAPNTLAIPSMLASCPMEASVSASRRRACMPWGESVGR